MDDQDYYLEEEQRESGKQLSFNVAQDYAYTINTTLKNVESLWQKGKLESAMWALYSVWNMSYPFFSGEDNSAIEKSFNGMIKMWVKKKNRSFLNMNLGKINRHIRHKLNSRGMLIPNSEDPRFIFKKT